MILAAGFGTRMGPLTKATPKPLLPVAGRALIDHALDCAQQAGVAHCVVNLHYLGEQIEHHLGGRQLPRLEFSREANILDTGGGVAQALPSLGMEPFFTLNSDAVFIGTNPLGHLTKHWNPSRMDALLLLVPVTAALAYARQGDFFLDQQAAPPRRRGLADAAPYIYGGAQILSPVALKDVPDGAFSLNLVWDRLLATGRLAATVYDGRWVDVGTPAGLDLASDALAAHRQ